MRDDNRVSYLTGTTRFIKFYIYGRIINHFEYHHSTDHCHPWFLEPSDQDSQDEVGQGLAPSEEPVYFQQTGCSSAINNNKDSDHHSGGGDEMLVHDSDHVWIV